MSTGLLEHSALLPRFEDSDIPHLVGLLAFASKRGCDGKTILTPIHYAVKLFVIYLLFNTPNTLFLLDILRFYGP